MDLISTYAAASSLLSSSTSLTPHLIVMFSVYHQLPVKTQNDLDVKIAVTLVLADLNVEKNI